MVYRTSINMCWIVLLVVLVLLAEIIPPSTAALSISNPSSLATCTGRREFIDQTQSSIVGISVSLSSSSAGGVGLTEEPAAVAAIAGTHDRFNKISSAFQATNLRWQTNDDDDIPVDWTRIRYGTSSLNGKSRVAPTEATLARFPTWLEGDWSTVFRFKKGNSR
jgi:hypothetical protein